MYSKPLHLGLFNKTTLVLGLFLIIFLFGIAGANINYLSKVKSVFEARIGPEMPIISKDIGQDIGQEIGQIELDEEIEEIVQQAVQSENNPVTLEAIQEMLDDIAEMIDILNQEVAELSGQPLEEEKEQEYEEEETEGEIEEEKEIKEEIDSSEDLIVEQKVEPKKESTRTRSNGGGGSSSGPSYCNKALNTEPLSNKVIINEVSWMGTKESSNNEWIELKNVSNDSVNLSNYQLLDKEKQIKIIFSQDTVLAGEFYLLERTDDSSVPDISSDHIYTGALNNTNETIYLFDNNCLVQDEVKADPDWPAGDKDENKSMERGNDLSWHTYSGQDMGTPKAENSLPDLKQGKCPDVNKDGKVDVLDMVLVRNKIGQEHDDMDLNNDNKVDIQDLEYLRAYLGQTDLLICPKQELPEEPVKILINEIQIDGLVGVGGVDDDWVELYNPNDIDISLSGWSIQEHSASDPCSMDTGFSMKKFPDEANIPAQGFFLIVSTKANDLIGALADMKISWSLTNNNTIYLVGNQDKIENGQDADIIDKVGFGQSCFPETESAIDIPEAKSIERKELGIDTDNNNYDFEIKDIPSPINSQGGTY